MSLYTLALGVFLLLIGVQYTFSLDSALLRLLTGLAALVAGVLCFLGDRVNFRA